MNKQEHLTIVAIEECAEVQQALSKALRFGFDDHHPSREDRDNAFETLTEFYQLTAMIEELQKLNVLPQLTETQIAEIKQNKIEKVYHYMNYSKERGLLE